jgi:hypothetical protein
MEFHCGLRAVQEGAETAPKGLLLLVMVIFCEQLDKNPNVNEMAFVI